VVWGQRPPSEPSAPILRSPHEYYNLPLAEQQREHTISFTFTVLHHDPEWKVLWGSAEGTRFFLPLGTAGLPMRSGDIISLTGTLSSARGLRADPSDCRKVGTAPTPEFIEANLVTSKIGEFDHQFVHILGAVDYVQQPDKNHLKIGLLVNRTPMTLITPASTPLPKLGAILRASGLLAIEATSIGTQNINIWIDDPARIEIKGWVQADPRLRLPIISVAKCLASVGSEAAHLRGRIKDHEAGVGVWMTDDSGEIFVESPQRTVLPRGTLIEAIGTPSNRGNRPLLADATYFGIEHIASGEPTQQATRPVITSIGDLYILNPEDRQEDVSLDAVFRVLYYDPMWKVLWAEDNKARFYIQPGDTPLSLRSGQLVHLKGVYSDPKGLRARDDDIDVLEATYANPPVDVTGQTEDMRILNGRFVQITGYAEKIARTDERHDNFALIVGNRRLTVTLLREPGQATPQIHGAIVRVQGLFSFTDAHGNQPESYSLWAPSLQNVQHLQWLRTDPRFSLPTTSAERLLEAPAGSYVRVAGQVAAVSPGKHVDIRDASGQIRLLCAQQDRLEMGERIEAIGTPANDGLRAQLASALYIRSASAIQSTGAINTSQALSLLNQVANLTNTEATRKFPVVARALVTWSHPSRRDFFAEDSSGGLQLILGDPSLPVPQVGDLCDIIGESDGEATYPRIKVSLLKRLRDQPPPEAQIITLDQAKSGIGHGSMIQLRGLLTEAIRQGPFLSLTILSSTGTFNALLPATEDVTPLLRNIVEIQGISSLSPSGLRTPDLTLLLTKASQIIPAQGPVDQLSTLPSVSLAAFSLNPPRARDERWIRTFGTVTHAQQGSHLYVQDGTQTLRVFSASRTPLSPGDHVDIFGLPVWLGDQLVLREASVVKTRTAEAPSPIVPSQPYRADRHLDSMLVTLQGTLAAQLEVGALTTLSLRNDNRFFTAELRRPLHANKPLDLPENSTARLTGIYHYSTSDNGTPQFSLELRSEKDIDLLTTPSWWTAERALAVAAALLLITVGALAWILQLRKVVQEQTLTIRRQVEKEAQLTAELERATRLEQLGMLAGGIAHDFNNMLTIIVGNLNLARMEDGVEAVAGCFLHEAERGAMRARNLTQQLLTFARGGNPARKAEDLGKVLREEAEDSTNNNELTLTFNIPDNLPAAFIDRAQISQVVHAILANSIQAGATRCTLSIERVDVQGSHSSGLKPGPYLKASIQDDGPGIPQENLVKVFDPYFTTRQGRRGLGLSLVRSIVVKHDGHVSIASDPERGVILSLWLPIAPNELARNTPPEGTPGTNTPATPSSEAKTPAFSVLLMDDEAPIRLMISALLRKLGHRVVLTAEGGAAIREYKAAMENGRRFDLVILDLSVPNGMGGMETMDQLRQLDPKVLAIVSSGYCNDPIMADHKSFGFAAMVPKPYQIEDLRKTVVDLLEHTHKS